MQCVLSGVKVFLGGYSSPQKQSVACRAETLALMAMQASVQEPIDMNSGGGSSLTRLPAEEKQPWDLALPSWGNSEGRPATAEAVVAGPAAKT